MAKVTLVDVGNLIEATTAATTINSNSAAIEAAVEKTLSRDGTSPNQMQAALDMNSNRIVNLPAPITLLEPVRLTDLNDIIDGGTITVEPLPVGGTAGQILNKLTSSNYDVSWVNPNASVTASTIAELKAINTNFEVAFLTVAGREGTFIWKTGDYSTALSKDTNNGVYVKSNDFPTTSGSWVREFDFINYYTRWFGTVNDFSTDNTTVINSIIEVTTVVNTSLSPGRQTAAYVHVEGGVKFASANIQFLPSTGYCYLYLKYFANSDTTKGVASGGDASNEQHLLSVNSGYPDDPTGGMVAVTSFDSPLHPANIVNISKQQSGADAHFGGFQVRIPTSVNPARASYNILDENVLRFRTVYENYGALVGSGVSLQPFSATVELVNVGSNGWAAIPANGTIFWGLTSGGRAVKTGHNASAIQGLWLTGTFTPGEQITDGVTISANSISGGGATFTNGNNPSLIFGTTTPTAAYGLVPETLTTAFGFGGRVTLAPTNTTLSSNRIEAVTNPAILWTTDAVLATTGRQIGIDSNNRLISISGVTAATTGQGNVGGVTSHGIAIHAGIGAGAFNLTSFTNLGTGSYRITFPAKASTNYALSVMSDNPLDQITYGTKTTTTVLLSVINIVSRAARDLAGEISITITGGDI